MHLGDSQRCSFLVLRQLHGSICLYAPLDLLILLFNFILHKDLATSVQETDTSLHGSLVFIIA